MSRDFGRGAGEKAAAQTEAQIAPPGSAAESSPPYVYLAADGEGIRAFGEIVLCHYRREGRSFPWRETRDPWALLVSEIMLQQTRTDRVVPKYLAWMKAYPDPASMAAAPLREVLSLWSGLGYNRRALALAGAAAALAGLESFPDDEAALRELPGVGPYTARAVLAFAFDRPVVLVETNVRSAYLQHFFPGEEGVPDARILPLVAASMASEPACSAGARAWYWALMDYGAALKRRIGNPNRRSAHYARQSPFADSGRRIRGAILRELGKGPTALESLAAALPFAGERVEAALADLVKEGFAEVAGEIASLAASLHRERR